MRSASGTADDAAELLGGVVAEVTRRAIAPALEPFQETVTGAQQALAKNNKTLDERLRQIADELYEVKKSRDALAAELAKLSVCREQLEATAGRLARRQNLLLGCMIATIVLLLLVCGLVLLA